jgi:hypothetical protein
MDLAIALSPDGDVLPESTKPKNGDGNAGCCGSGSTP